MDIELSLEDIEQELGKSLTDEQLDLAAERICRYRGFNGLLEVLLVRVKLELSGHEANLEVEVDDDGFLKQEIKNHKKLIKKIDALMKFWT